MVEVVEGVEELVEELETVIDEEQEEN